MVTYYYMNYNPSKAWYIDSDLYQFVVNYLY